MRGHSIAPEDLQPTRAEGDTAERAVAIDSGLGSERLELHVTEYDPGRSQPRTLEDLQEIIYTVSGRVTLFVDGEAHELEPMTGAYVAAGETYEVENPGPEQLLLVSATAPNENGVLPRAPAPFATAISRHCPPAATASSATSSPTRSAAAT